MAAGPRLLSFNDVETAYDDPERVGRLAGSLAALRDDRTLVLDAGDSTALGALAFATDEGRGHARPFFDAVLPDAHVPGNHDFDPGLDWFVEFVAETPGEWLAANVLGLDLPGNLVRDVEGTRVGLIGVAHPDTPNICAAAATLDVTDPVDAVRRESARLRRRGAEHVVVLSHCGGYDVAIARETDADIVLGGHDSERVVRRIGGTLVARTGGQGRAVVAATLAGESTAEVRETANASTDESVAREYRDRLDAAGLDERVATLDRTLPRRSVAGFVARAYRERGDADAAIVLEASARRSLASAVTTADVVGAVPFGSTLVVLAVPGTDLRDALSVSRHPIDGTHGRAIWAGADPDRGTVNGRPPDTDRKYRVAMMSYAANAGLLPGVGPERIVEDRGPQHEHVLAYVRDGGLELES